jgi:excisionase family DNA binding protein
MDELLTVAEAAACLRVSWATLWRWCQEGRLPAFKIGHEWRIIGSDLKRLIAADVAPSWATSIGNFTHRAVQ